MLSPLTAITAQRVAVEIEHQGKDNVGSRLVYQIKEEIRRSSGLRLTTIKEPRLVVHVMTMENSFTPPETNSVLGVIINSTEGWLVELVNGERFLTATIGSCGRGPVNEMAESIIARIDKEAEPFRK